MIRLLRRCWSAAPIASLVLIAALALGGLFAARTIRGWSYWHDPAHREQTIAAWMTPGYVAHSWRVPQAVVLEAIAAPTHPDHPLTLDEIAARRGVPVAQVMDEAEAAIRDWRAAQSAEP